MRRGNATGDAQRWQDGCQWLGISPFYVIERRKGWLRKAAAKVRGQRALGLSVPQIAERVGVSTQTIYRWLREAGGVR